MSSPISLGLTRADISELALPFYEQVFSLRQPQDFAKHFGMTIDMDASQRAYHVLANISSTRFWVGLETGQTIHAMRIKLMMAVGHSVLHLFPQGLIINDEVSEMTQEEARWFAIGAFMPRARFQEQVLALNGQTKLLSEYFGVSEKHIELRAKSLDVMLPAKRTAFNLYTW